MKFWQIFLLGLIAFLATTHADREENNDDVEYDDPTAEPEPKPEVSPEPEPEAESTPKPEAQGGDNGSILNAASYLTIILPMAVTAVWRN